MSGVYGNPRFNDGVELFDFNYKKPDSDQEAEALLKTHDKSTVHQNKETQRKENHADNVAKPLLTHPSPEDEAAITTKELRENSFSVPASNHSAQTTNECVLNLELPIEPEKAKPKPRSNSETSRQFVGQNCLVSSKDVSRPLGKKTIAPSAVEEEPQPTPSTLMGRISKNIKEKFQKIEDKVMIIIPNKASPTGYSKVFIFSLASSYRINEEIKTSIEQKKWGKIRKTGARGLLAVGSRLHVLISTVIDISMQIVHQTTDTWSKLKQMAKLGKINYYTDLAKLTVANTKTQKCMARARICKNIAISSLKLIGLTFANIVALPIGVAAVTLKGVVLFVAGPAGLFSNNFNKKTLALRLMNWAELCINTIKKINQPLDEKIFNLAELEKKIEEARAKEVEASKKQLSFEKITEQLSQGNRSLEERSSFILNAYNAHNDYVNAALNRIQVSIFRVNKEYEANEALPAKKRKKDIDFRNQYKVLLDEKEKIENAHRDYLGKFSEIHQSLNQQLVELDSQVKLEKPQGKLKPNEKIQQSLDELSYALDRIKSMPAFKTLNLPGRNAYDINNKNSIELYLKNVYDNISDFVNSKDYIEPESFPSDINLDALIKKVRTDLILLE